MDRQKDIISVSLKYPDSSRNRKGFNPIIYPYIYFKYTVQVKSAQWNSIIIKVNLDKSLPAKWIGKIGFNLELFPGSLFGKNFLMDDKAGSFPRNPVVAMQADHEGNLQPQSISCFCHLQPMML